MLKDLNSWNYLNQSSPKSLSNQQVQNFYLPLLDNWELPVEDKMKTFIHHVCDNILRWVENEHTGESLLLSGGGARNQTIAQLLEKKYTSGVSIMDPKWLEYKEAFLMAFMGYLRWQEIPNVLSSVTGSAEDHSAGIIHHPS